ncbi:hypothetical protein ARSEF1564_006830 [Beauveria bassiana]
MAVMTISGPEFALNDGETEFTALSSITNTGSAHDKADMTPAVEAAFARHDQQDSYATAPMSIYAVLRAESRRRLYVHPIVWTAHHLELLGARFDAVIRLDRQSAGRVQATSDISDNQARALKPPWCNRAILHVARSLVRRHDPYQQRAALGELLRTYGLQQVDMGRDRRKIAMQFRGKTVCHLRVQCVWSTRTGDRMMVSTNFDSISESRHRWVQGGESRARLYDRGDTAGYIMRGKKLKALQPAEAHQDPYIWGLLIALAQAQRRRQAAALDDAVARWRLCLLALPGAGARQLYCYRGWVPAAMLLRQLSCAAGAAFSAAILSNTSSSNDFPHQDDTKQDQTPPPPYLEYIPVYGEWERKRYPNWPDARFQMPATKEHAGQVYHLRKGELVGFGTTALVERLPSGNAIVKTPLQNPLSPAEERMNREAVAREAEVYQRLSSGDGNDKPIIPRFLGWDAQSCTLILEHQSNGDLATYFRDNDAASGVDLETRGKWATQAARALASLHDKEVIHADVAPRNFLLNSSLDLSPVADGTAVLALWLAGGTLLPSQTHVISHHLRVFRTGQVADCPRGAPRQPSLFPSRPRAGERVALRGAQSLAQQSSPFTLATAESRPGIRCHISRRNHPPDSLPVLMYMNTIDVLVTGAAGILLARSLFKMIRDREPQGAPASTSPQRDARRRTKRRRSPVSAPLRKRLPRRVAPGSVLDIMRCNSGTALFVRPLCWTDLHAELLKIQFNELPICDTPMPVNEPGSPPPKGHMQPSQSIVKLSETLSDILSYKIAHPTAVSDAVCTIMAKLWPDSFCQYHVVPDLHLFFGDKVYHEAVRAQIMWMYPSGSCPPSQTRPISSQSTQDAASSPESRFSDSTLPSRHVLTDQPMVCYMGKAQLASIRRNMFRIAPGPNRQFNEPVSSLFKLRSKNLEPQNPDEDSYIAGMLLAMAQKHFYPNPRISSLFRRGISPSKNARPFRDLKLRFMTHDIERAQFIVYTGHMTATFLERFRRPHRMPPAPEFDGDPGFNIDYVRVPIWPILGLRERLGKALGQDLVGEFDPEVMETWEEDDVETPDSSGSKRKRTALGEVVNGSFEDTEEEESSPIHSKRQCMRPRTPLQAVA